VDNFREREAMMTMRMMRMMRTIRMMRRMTVCEGDRSRPKASPPCMTIVSEPV
jgi:hypothetical protein